MLSIKLKALKRTAEQPKVSISYLKSKIDNLFNSYHHSAIEIPPHPSLGKFHRSRIVNNKPEHIRDLSYPPYSDNVVLPLPDLKFLQFTKKIIISNIYSFHSINLKHKVLAA